MKIVDPKSFEEFKAIICEPTNGRVDYYRGQSDYSWNITPSLARNPNIKNIDNLIVIENKLIEQFDKKIIYNKLESLIPKSNVYDKSWILMMAAQHYGLPTRLLDFSHDIFSALQFAVADIENLNKDGALILYKKADLVQEELSILEKPFNNNYIKSFFLQVPSFGSPDNNESNLSEKRKPIQGSKFLYIQTHNIQQCLSLDNNHSYNLTMVHIPKTIKLDIIKWLIDNGKMAYDIYAGKNFIDYFSAILKDKFKSINDSNIKECIENDDFWKC